MLHELYGPQSLEDLKSTERRSVPGGDTSSDKIHTVPGVSNGFHGKSVILDSIEGERCVSFKLRLRAGVSSSKRSKDNEFTHLWGSVERRVTMHAKNARETQKNKQKETKQEFYALEPIEGYVSYIQTSCVVV